MEDQITTTKKQSRFSLFNAIIILIMLLALLGAVYLLLINKAKNTVKSGEPIITQLKELKRYETSAFTIEQIIEAGDEGNQFRDILFGDRILLIAHGEVIAGFDLSGLTDENLKIRNDSVTLTLPAPVILLTRLDNEKTRVYDRQRGFLTQGNKDLESEARRSAEETIRKAACDGRILETASDNAKRQLAAIIKSFGFIEVTIEIPRGECN